MPHYTAEMSDAPPSLTQQYFLFCEKGWEQESFCIDAWANNSEQVVYTTARMVAWRIEFQTQLIKKTSNREKNVQMTKVRARILNTRKKIGLPIIPLAEADMMWLQEISVWDILQVQPAEDQGLWYPSRREPMCIA